jgi:antitoxin YefM
MLCQALGPNPQRTLRVRLRSIPRTFLASDARRGGTPVARRNGVPLGALDWTGWWCLAPGTELHTMCLEAPMTTLKASDARSRLSRLIDQAASTHQPIMILGKRNNAVLISAEDWRSIEETLFLLSVLRMHASILEGKKTPLSRCLKKLKW